MMKRKHKVVVEITFQNKVTERQATHALGSLLDTIDKDMRPANLRAGYVDRMVARSFNNVFRSECSKRGLWREAPTQ